MTEQTTEFIPFHAINEFMRPDYRLRVVREVLHTLPLLKGEHRSLIERLTRKYVQVPGFRNSQKAPAGLRATPTVEAFEKHPDLVAVILSAWADHHANLRQQVFDLLTDRRWPLFLIELDRASLPGFAIRWLAQEDFDGLNKTIQTDRIVFICLSGNNLLQPRDIPNTPLLPVVK
jgi:hypothetical protein